MSSSEPLNESHHIAARRAAGLTGCVKCRDTGEVDFPAWMRPAARPGVYGYRRDDRKTICNAPGCGAFALKMAKACDDHDPNTDLAKALKHLLDEQEGQG